MPEPAALFFFDTVSLSNFALAERLDLLLGRYGTRAILTSEVLDEIAEGIAREYTALEPVDRLAAEGAFGRTSLRTEERPLYTALLRNLGPGEASAIASAKLRYGVVVTDDRAARACCLEHDVLVTGTIGILKALCREAVISSEEADGILDAMVTRGFYSPVRRISTLL